MHLQRISSLSTVFHKFVVPVVFGIGLLNPLIIWGPERDTLLFMLAAVVFEAYIIWLDWSLKAVAIDETNNRLYVSNYRKEIAIPFSEIAKVTQFIFSEPRRMTIDLHNESEFGKKIVFLGKYRFPGGIFAGSHPIVDELCKLSIGDRPPRIPKLGPR